MAKRKITVTVDEELVDRAHQLGAASSLSAVVNDALATHVERLDRLAGLRDVLESWERRYGPVGPEERADAAAAFDELDGLGEVPGQASPPARALSRGARDSVRSEPVGV